MRRIISILCVLTLLFTSVSLHVWAKEESPAVTAEFRIDNLVEFLFHGVSGNVTIYGTDSENGENKVLIGEDISTVDGKYTYDASLGNPEYYEYYWVTDSRGEEYKVATEFLFPRRSKEITNLTHPFVATTQENIDRTKELIQTDDWYKGQFGNYKKTADNLYKSVMLQEESLPRGENNYNLSDAAVNGAVMWVLTSEQKYLDLTRHAYFLMVEHLRDEEAFERETKNDMWYSEKTILSYDLVYNALNEVDRQTIENGLIRRWVEVSDSLGRGHLSNMGGNNPTNLIAGLVLKDHEMVDRAVNREGYGYKYQMLNGVHDDGSMWNYPSMYFAGITEDLFNLAEYMWYSGYDVYNWELNGTRPTEWEASSKVYRDVENGDIAEVVGKKPLEEVLEFALAYVWPNMYYLSNGDTSRGTYGLKQQILVRVFEMANLHYDDPRIDYMLNLKYQVPPLPGQSEPDVIKRGKDSFTNIYDMLNAKPTLDKGGDYFIGSNQFATKGYNKLGTSVFRDYGTMIFRNYGDPTKAVNSSVWWANYFEDGHGHNDMMNLTLFGNGKELVYDTGSWTYGTALHTQYARATVGHNTVMIDKENYSSESYASAPSYIHKGFLDSLSVGPKTKAGKIWTDRVYVAKDPNHKLERTLWQVDDYVIDVFRAKLAGEHTFDYLLNIDSAGLTASTANMESVTSTDLGGYQYIQPYNYAKTENMWSNTYDTGDGTSFKVTMLGENDTEVMPSKAVNRDEEYVSEKLLVSRKAKDETTFITILEPVGKEKTARTITPAKVTLGKKEIDWADACTITGGPEGETDTFMYGYSYGVRTAGDLSTDGETAFLRVDTDGKDEVLGGVGMKYISGNEVALKFNTITSAQFTRLADNLWRLDTADGIQSDGKVTIYGLPNGYSLYRAELANEHVITKVDMPNYLSFEIDSNAIYYLADSEETMYGWELPVSRFETEADAEAVVYDYERELLVQDLEVASEQAMLSSSEKVLIEAEDFTESKGDSTLKFASYETDSHTTDNEKGTGIYGWDAIGTNITWKFDVPKAGKYKLVLKYSTAAASGAVRALSVNDDTPYVLFFENTGGWGERRPGLIMADEENAYICELKKGENTLFMDNLTTALNLDYIMFVPVE